MAGGDLRLLVAIPALDEAPTVGDVVRGIPREIPGIARVDVLVIDDGSSDDTARVARDAGAEVVTRATNRGLGVSFREAGESGRARGT